MTDFPVGAEVLITMRESGPNNFPEWVGLYATVRYVERESPRRTIYEVKLREEDTLRARREILRFYDGDLELALTSEDVDAAIESIVKTMRST